MLTASAEPAHYHQRAERDGEQQRRHMRGTVQIESLHAVINGNRNGAGLARNIAAHHHHQPLRQRMVLMRGAGPAAERLYAYLQSPAARAVLNRYGFRLPAQ